MEAVVASLETAERRPGRRCPSAVAQSSDELSALFERE